MVATKRTYTYGRKAALQNRLHPSNNTVPCTLSKAGWKEEEEEEEKRERGNGGQSKSSHLPIPEEGGREGRRKWKGWRGNEIAKICCRRLLLLV